MENNEQKTFQNESEFKDLFAQVKQADLKPSPYMKTRVLAHVKEAQSARKTLRFWQFLSAGSLASVVVVGVFALQMMTKNPANEPQANQAYVIHVDFNQEDLTKVAKAEVVLPDDVYFKSSKGKIYEARNLKLPIQVKNTGRGKLPFVVSSAVEGVKDIKIRLLDENDQVIREQTIKFKFAKTSQQVTL